jgi:hypothetical protein
VNVCTKVEPRRPTTVRMAVVTVASVVAVILLTAGGCKPTTTTTTTPPKTTTTTRPKTPTTTTTPPTTTTTTTIPLPELPEAQPIQAYVGTGPRVVVFGDSLAFGATDQAHAALTDFALSWNTWGATTWPDYTPHARSVVTIEADVPRADVAVMALGTNQLWDGWQASDQADLNQFLRALGSPPCTVLVSYASGGPVLDLFGQPNPAYPPAETLANAALASAAKSRTTFGAPTVVIDWGKVAKATPGTFGWDNVHHTAAGDVLWATWIKAELTRLTSGACR